MTESQNPVDLPGDFSGEEGGVATATDDSNGQEAQVNVGPLGELSLEAPDGARWDYGEVKTNRGTQSLGKVPILVWDDPQKAIEFYGQEAFLAAFNNTGLRVPFQSIARRKRVAGVVDANEIAQEMIDYKPGETERAAPTAASRAASAAKRATEALSEGGKDLFTTLLDKVAKGEISEAQLQSMLGGQG